jgi:hypothetical protein
MQLIHITTEAQFNVAKRTMKACGKKPFEIQPAYYGPCYLQDTDNYLILRKKDLTEDSEIIPFDDFLREAI